MRVWKNITILRLRQYRKDLHTDHGQCVISRVQGEKVGLPFLVAYPHHFLHLKFTIRRKWLCYVTWFKKCDRQRTVEICPLSCRNKTALRREPVFHKLKNNQTRFRRATQYNNFIWKVTVWSHHWQGRQCIIKCVAVNIGLAGWCCFVLQQRTGVAQLLSAPLLYHYGLS